MTDQSDVNRVASDPSLLKKPIKAGIQSVPGCNPFGSILSLTSDLLLFCMKQALAASLLESE